MAKDKLLRALALAFVHYPRATLQEISQYVGVSKATLYRMATTREQLVNLVRAYAIQRIRECMDAAELEAAAPLTAISAYTQAMIANRQYCAFVLTDFYQMSLIERENALNVVWANYRARMIAFFLRGQKEGVFRIDMPASWLSDSFDFLILAAVDSEQHGMIGVATAAGLVEKIFLQGATVNKE